MELGLASERMGAEEEVGRFTEELAFVSEIVILLRLRDGGRHQHQHYEAHNRRSPSIYRAFPHFQHRIAAPPRERDTQRERSPALVLVLDVDALGLLGLTGLLV